MRKKAYVGCRLDVVYATSGDCTTVSTMTEGPGRDHARHPPRGVGLPSNEVRGGRRREGSRLELTRTSLQRVATSRPSRITLATLDSVDVRTGA